MVVLPSHSPIEQQSTSQPAPQGCSYCAIVAAGGWKEKRCLRAYIPEIYMGN